jgi:hypothetical protein
MAFGDAAGSPLVAAGAHCEWSSPSRGPFAAGGRFFGHRQSARKGTGEEEVARAAAPAGRHAQDTRRSRTGLARDDGGWRPPCRLAMAPRVSCRPPKSTTAWLKSPCAEV